MRTRSGVWSTIGARSAGTPADECHALRGALDAIEDDLLRWIGEGACGQLQFHFVGDDVSFRAAVNITYGDYRGIARIFLPADDGLELDDELCTP